MKTTDRAMRGAEIRAVLESMGLGDVWLATACEVSTSTVGRWWAEDRRLAPRVARLVVEDVISGAEDMIDQAVLAAAREPITVSVPRSDRVDKKRMRGYEMPASFWRVIAGRIYLQSRSSVSVRFSGPPGGTAWNSDPANDPSF